ncbi:MAG: hypothetical protein CME06_03545 [Gemmatimonadetes bacterium]|nr:hypothetical protein [Gemmatimonadota bacterium]
MISLRPPGSKAARRANLRTAAQSIARGRTRVSHRPVEAFLEIVRDCNIRCTMCAISFDDHYRVGPRDDRGLMPIELFERSLPLLRRAAKVHLMGTGEPLLHPELPEMVRRLTRWGAWVTFNTNGTLLEPELARTLCRARLSQIVLSLDGATASTHESIRRGASFPRIIENIRFLNDQDGAPELIVAMVLMRENLDEIEAMIELSAGLGARFLHVEPLLWQDDAAYGEFYDANAVPRNEARVRVAEASAAAESLGVAIESPLLASSAGEPGEESPGPICSEPWTTLYVTKDGRLRACCNGTEDLGSLGGDGGGWNDAGFARYRRLISGEKLPADCGSCAVNRRFRKVLPIDAPMLGIPASTLPPEVR